MPFIYRLRLGGSTEQVAWSVAAGGTGNVTVAVTGGGGDEPTFDSGVDTMIYDDSFDDHATIGARYTQLVNLRNSQGSNHDVFISDNRSTEEDPSFGFDVISPGRGGSGRALRSEYAGGGGQEVSDWVGWPTGQSKYSPTTATVVFQCWIRIQNNWTPCNDGIKWFEMWLHNGEGRLQSSPFGGSDADPPVVLQWGENPAGPPDSSVFGTQKAGTTSWDDINDGNWHRWTWLYRAATSYGDGSGICRIWIDGTKIIDVSSLGVTEGFCTSAEVDYIPNYAISHVLFPDVLLDSGCSGAGTIDYDDFKWWKEG